MPLPPQFVKVVCPHRKIPRRSQPSANLHSSRFAAAARCACAQVGLPFFSFILLGWLGLQQGLSAKLKEGERRKRYVEPEKPEDILAVRAGRRETCAPGSRRPHGTSRAYIRSRNICPHDAFLAVWRRMREAPLGAGGSMLLLEFLLSRKRHTSG